ncbi:MAG TPA: bifunctional glutamate N-acetyltransferase/amino-acid acetyltransferase ArgJ [Planctomycetota bacterium]|nr:bifunctional glutamate N-acetyltransferase/amino-acid acetyltransferase ArgJ [Planctomycetota bacterium]
MEWSLAEGELLRPGGFTAAAVACGLKKGGALDLALLRADPPAPAAALFTKNRVRAAPVTLSAEHLGATGGRAAAILVNSGCANAATGPAGAAAAAETARLLAERLRVPPEQVLLASTGVIGVPLDLPKIAAAIPRLQEGLSTDGLESVSRAILTTDTRAKTASARADVEGRDVSIAGFAKGAGMIHPDLATMLVFLATDARASASTLRSALRRAADESFNRISIDGDTSTNDSVFLLASGASGVPLPPISLAEGLEAVCRSLALQIVRDGEGATKLLEVEVLGALTSAEAEALARTIGSSLLVRTAVAGGDPNWGRILAAIGRARVPFDLGRLRVEANGVPLFVEGGPADSPAAEKKRVFDAKEIRIRVDLRRGSSRARFWTSDLTEEYVRINARYTT